MEREIKTFIVAIFTAAILLALLTSCGSKPDIVPNTQDAVKAKMTANTWDLQSVSVDGVDQTGVYKNLTIKFTGTNFTSTNGGVVWPASGTWEFTSLDATSFKRDDGIEVNVEATDVTLRLTLTWTKTTLGGGRIESVKGKNVFNLVK